MSYHLPITNTSLSTLVSQNDHQPINMNNYRLKPNDPGFDLFDVSLDFAKKPQPRIDRLPIRKNTTCCWCFKSCITNLVLVWCNVKATIQSFVSRKLTDSIDRHGLYSLTMNVAVFENQPVQLMLTTCVSKGKYQ